MASKEDERLNLLRNELSMEIAGQYELQLSSPHRYSGTAQNDRACELQCIHITVVIAVQLHTTERS